MRLKAACWFFATLTALSLLGWPSLVGLPPKGGSRIALAHYARISEIWFAVMISAFLLTTILAALVVRQTRREYLDESAANLRSLIEGTLEDHKKKSESEAEPS